MIKSIDNLVISSDLYVVSLNKCLYLDPIIISSVLLTLKLSLLAFPQPLKKAYFIQGLKLL